MTAGDGAGEETGAGSGPEAPLVTSGHGGSAASLRVSRAPGPPAEEDPTTDQAPSAAGHSGQVPAEPPWENGQAGSRSWKHKSKTKHQAVAEEGALEQQRKPGSARHRRDAKFEGTRVPHLVKRRPYHRADAEPEPAAGARSGDDYVLEKLFKKSGNVPGACAAARPGVFSWIQIKRREAPETDVTPFCTQSGAFFQVSVQQGAGRSPAATCRRSARLCTDRDACLTCCTVSFSSHGRGHRRSVGRGRFPDVREWLGWQPGRALGEGGRHCSDSSRAVPSIPSSPGPLGLSGATCPPGTAVTPRVPGPPPSETTGVRGTSERLGLSLVSFFL